MKRTKTPAQEIEEIAQANLKAFVENKRGEEQTIELDCAPGAVRPGDLIGAVIEGLGLPTREPVLKFFGHWVWEYNDIDGDHWKSIKGTLGERIRELYALSLIRYGSW